MSERDDVTVAVLLPTHSRPRTIIYAIDSVLAQTHAALELHIVCDGCDAATDDVVARVNDPRVRFHRRPKAPGYGYANRNAVLRLTSAPWIAYISDDDLWFPDHLEVSLASLRVLGSGLVASRSVLVKPPGRLDPHFFAFDWCGLPGGRVLGRWFVGSAPLVHHRSVLERVGYWDETLERFGDREFYARVLRSSVPTGDTNAVTIVRFLALHWDHHYPGLDPPPQAPVLGQLRDPDYRDWVRGLPGQRRSVATRAEQLADFVRFAARSGPRFLRYQLHGLRSFWNDRERG
jgi:glycosyltransferase involved in cell wall biosynthesis